MQCFVRTVEFVAYFKGKEILSHAIVKDLSFFYSLVSSDVSTIKGQTNGVLSTVWEHFERLEVCGTPSHIRWLVGTWNGKVLDDGLILIGNPKCMV